MKIAVICTLFFSKQFHGISYQHEKNLLDIYKKCVEVLFKSGKKYFLPNHEVEFLLITNHDFIELNHLDYVKLIKVDYDIHNNWHGYLMKLLGIEFVPKEYDYIFSLDVDQIFVNEVVDDDVLSHDFVVMKHWSNPTYSSILSEVTNFIDIDFNGEEEFWVLGNFFGGKSKKMYELFEKSNKIHNDLLNKKIMEHCNFYSMYPEEMFVGKYINENNVNYKYLTGSLGFDEGEEAKRSLFLGDFEHLWRKYVQNDNDETIFQNITNVKLIHQTKINMDAFKIFSKYYI
jgi:hypothetical protein